MIRSNILGKSYKTVASYKTNITKYEKQIKRELECREEGYKKGWATYLGDPINPQIRSLKRELFHIKIERDKVISGK